MQNVKKVLTLKMLTVNFLVILSSILVFSCSKDANESLTGEKPVEDLSGSSAKAQVYNSIEILPYERILFVPCGNGGGEEVSLSGSIKIIDQLTINGHGFVFNYHVNPQGVSGVGLTSGESYVASGGNQGVITGEFGENGQYTNVYIMQFRVIGQHNVFNVRYKYKVTITANGVITTSIEDEEVNCIM